MNQDAEPKNGTTGPDEVPDQVRAFLRRIGSKGGKAEGKSKIRPLTSEAARKHAEKRWRAHKLEKLRKALEGK